MDLDFEKNLGNVDRGIRVFAGVLLLAAFLTRAVSGFWAVAAVIISLSQFIEAYFAY